MAVEYINGQVARPQVKEKARSEVKTHVVSLSKIEKLVYLGLVTLIALVAVVMISFKYDAYDTNANIANVQSQIIHQESVNSELKSEVMKQASYERIYSKAKGFGLSLNNDNVKVVQKDGGN